MPQYLSPGVYVEEAPSAVKAIAGVGTSTAGFIGEVPNSLSSPLYKVTDEAIGKGNGTAKEFKLSRYPVVETHRHLHMFLHLIAKGLSQPSR